MQRRHITCGLGGLLAGLGAQASWAQAAAATYPSRNITLVAPFAGMTDGMGRVLGEVVATRTGQPVVVDTKPGGSGIIAAEYVLKAPPDGHVLFHTTNTTHAANQALFKSLPYDYVRDFVPVTGVLRGSLMLVVSADSPVKSVADLTERARKNPGKLSFGWGASAVRMVVEMYRQAANLEFLSVPYKTNGQAVVDMLGGRLDFMSLDALSAAPQIASGKMRAIAVSGDRRMPGFPDVPTMQESGFPGFSMTFWQGIYAPRGTPEAVVRRAATLFQEAIQSPQAQKFMQTVNVEPFPLSSQELMAFQQAEATKWKTIVATAGIQPE